MADEDRWRRRFFAYTAVRLAGLAIFFLGLAIAYSNLARHGGWPQLGAIIAVLGALGTVLAPHRLKKGWDHQDQQDRDQ